MTPPSDKGKAKVSIVIPVFNQLHYTRNCVNSLNRAGVADAQIIIVNNGSTDGTKEFLATRPEIRALHNATNLGCGHAWTQGAKLSAVPWTIVMNNDVLVPPGCVEGLVGFAEEEKFDIVSPAMCEGDADYNLLEYGGEFMRKMASVRRRDVAHGVCFMVYRHVFEAIGYFDDDPKLGGYEDDDFFRRARRAGFRMAITGRAFLHHFGSATQKDVWASRNQPKNGLGDRAYYRKKTGQTWPKRKWAQLETAVRFKWWKTIERLRYGHSLYEKKIGGEWHYC
jgi:GT2 family glycosyltransferase